MLQPLDVAVFGPLKHYFRCAVEKRLRTGASRFPKTEFVQTYSEIRLQAITERNIKAGFKKTGLVPFDPQKAIQRLILPSPPTPPPAQVNGTLRTPRNSKELHEVVGLLDGPGSVAIRAAKKIGSAAAIFQARAAIAEADCLQLREEVQKMEEAASRKRKRAAVNGPCRLKDVLEEPEKKKGRGRSGPVTQARVQAQQSTPLQEVDVDQESLAGAEIGNISDCIVVSFPC